MKISTKVLNALIIISAIITLFLLAKPVYKFLVQQSSKEIEWHKSLDTVKDVSPPQITDQGRRVYCSYSNDCIAIKL